jgi:DNA-binding NarL/FixJ family response regulator
VFDPAFALRVAPARASLVEDLTPRETQVLQLIAEGKSNKTIARELDISEHTVKFHVNAILGKLNAASRTEAVVLATRLGLVML